MRRGLVLIVLAAGLCALVAAPAGAVSLDGGCQGQGTSLEADGSQIMTATAPSAEPGTSGNPVLVDYDGTVQYSGSGPLMLNHHWEVKVFGITVKSGGAKNGTHQTSTSGTAVVKDYLPFKITGLYYVSGGISGEGGACSGSAYFKLIGSPVGTLPWIAAIVLIAGGILLGYAALPKAKPLPVVASGASWPPSTPPAAPVIADELPQPALSELPTEPPTSREGAPFAEPDPTIANPTQPPPPPPPPPDEGDAT